MPQAKQPFAPLHVPGRSISRVAISASMPSALVQLARLESRVWRELKESGNSSLPQLRLLSRWDEWLILTKSPKPSCSLPQMRAVMSLELNCSSMGVRHRSNRSVQLEKRIMPRPAPCNSDRPARERSSLPPNQPVHGSSSSYLCNLTQSSR